jgi:hypothetical protein
VLVVVGDPLLDGLKSDNGVFEASEILVLELEATTC